MTEVAAVTKTPLGELHIHTSPSYATVIYANRKNTLEDAKKHMSICKSFAGEFAPLPLLADIRNVKRSSKEVRDYINKNADNLISKVAVLVNSGLPKIIGNMFLSFAKPDYPTRIFTNKQKALEWLLA